VINNPVSLPPNLPREKRPAKEKAINNLKAVANSFTPREEPSALLRQDVTTGGTVYISLYSGAGGDSHGALVAGAEPILAVDGCREMLLAHAVNFPRCSHHLLALNGDAIVDDDGESTPQVTQDELVTLVNEEITKHPNKRVIIGAFPSCLLSSAAQQHQDHEMTCANIVWVYEVLIRCHCHYFFLENVNINLMQSRCVQLDLPYIVVQCQLFGLKSVRERMIMCSSNRAVEALREVSNSSNASLTAASIMPKKYTQKKNMSYMKYGVPLKSGKRWPVNTGLPWTVVSAGPGAYSWDEGSKRVHRVFTLAEQSDMMSFPSWFKWGEVGVTFRTETKRKKFIQKCLGQAYPPVMAAITLTAGSASLERAAHRLLTISEIQQKFV
jgi:site-specific DNA-cytosine methylase